MNFIESIIDAISAKYGDRVRKMKTQMRVMLFLYNLLVYGVPGSVVDARRSINSAAMFMLSIEPPGYISAVRMPEKIALALVKDHKRYKYLFHIINFKTHGENFVPHEDLIKDSLCFDGDRWEYCKGYPQSEVVMQLQICLM